MSTYCTINFISSRFEHTSILGWETCYISWWSSEHWNNMVLTMTSYKKHILCHGSDIKRSETKVLQNKAYSYYRRCTLFFFLFFLFCFFFKKRKMLGPFPQIIVQPTKCVTTYRLKIPDTGSPSTLWFHQNIKPTQESNVVSNQCWTEHTGSVCFFFFLNILNWGIFLHLLGWRIRQCAKASLTWDSGI